MAAKVFTRGRYRRRQPVPASLRLSMALAGVLLVYKPVVLTPYWACWGVNPSYTNWSMSPDRENA
jgi:hypothetical protein